MKYSCFRKTLKNLIFVSCLTLCLSVQSSTNDFNMISFADEGDNSNSAENSSSDNDSNDIITEETPAADSVQEQTTIIINEAETPAVADNEISDASETVSEVVSSNDISQNSVIVSYPLKVGDKDRKKDCPQGNINVNTAIEEYALALDGSFPNYYYYHEEGDLKAIQCCSMANHVIFNIFGEDIYDISNQGNSITSEPGQAIYDFLKANNAKSGDVLFSSYITRGKIRPHYIVINGYNEKGIWFTDGYAIHSGDNEDSATVIAHISSYENFDYTYFKDVSGTSPKSSSKSSEESISEEISPESNGPSTYWKLYPISQKNWENISQTKWVKDTFTKEDLKKQNDKKLKKDVFLIEDNNEDMVMHFHKKPTHKDKAEAKKNMLNRRKQRCSDDRETRASAASLCPSLDDESMSSDRNTKRSTE